MALTARERRAAAAARYWRADAWGCSVMSDLQSPVELHLCPAAEVAKARGVAFGNVATPGGIYVFAPLEGTGHETAHQALQDVATFVGYRDRSDLDAANQFLDGLSLNAEALRERFIGLVEGKPKETLPKLPRRRMLEGG